MNGYEKIVKMMQHSQKGSSPFVLGEMKSPTECVIDKLELDPDDYLINEDIKEKLAAGDTVLVLRYSEELYIIMAKVV